MAFQRRQRKKPSYNEQGERTYCICKQIDDGSPMIQCDACSDWFHFTCLNLDPENVPDSYSCSDCLGNYHLMFASPILEEPVVIKAKPEIKRNVDRSEVIRKTVRKTLSDTFTLMFDQLKTTFDLNGLDPKTLATDLEEALYEAFNESNEITSQYKNKFRSLQYNLKDSENVGLRKRILIDRLPFSELVRLSTEEMNDAIMQQAHLVKEASLKQVFKPKSAPKPKELEIKKEEEIEEKIIQEKSSSSAKIDEILVKMETPTASLDEILAKMETPTSSLDDLLSKMETPIAPAPIISEQSTVNETNLDDLLAEINAPNQSETSHAPRKRQKLSWTSEAKGEEIWRGSVIMPMVARFEASCIQIGGPTLESNLWNFFDKKWNITGRIKQKDAIQYISARKQKNLIFVIQMTSKDEEFAKLCEYLVEKERFGVIQNTQKIKDFYLIPLLANESFDPLGIREANENRLLGIMIMNCSLQDLKPKIETQLPTQAPELYGLNSLAAVQYQPQPYVTSQLNAGTSQLLNPQLIGGLLAQLLKK